MLTRQLTETVHLELPEDRHAAGMYAVVDANRDHLARWLPWAAGQTVEMTREFIRRSRLDYAEYRSLTLMITDDGRPIGTVGFNTIDWNNRKALIGYWLAEAAQGRGIMTMAVDALAEHAFGGLGLHRLEIYAGVENAPSRAVA